MDPLSEIPPAAWAKLTPGQRAFALAHECKHEVVECYLGATYLYAEGPAATVRYLVDGSGRVLKTTTFAREPRMAPPVAPRSAEGVALRLLWEQAARSETKP